uniref:Uncharacterized protein n=1 Tax=Helianthus annuus TaxID=4232 RepID=A0A251ULW0_HELAN
MSRKKNRHHNNKRRNLNRTRRVWINANRYRLLIPGHGYRTNNNGIAKLLIFFNF